MPIVQEGNAEENQGWTMKKTGQREWMAKGLIPKTHAVLLVGQPGQGKSWFAEQLAIAIISGTDFLGMYPVKKGSVIIVD
jgi:RecA-family ATPase